MNTVRYPYKPKVVIFLFATVFFAGCALVLGNVAINNERGLILNRIFEFSAGAATVFYWCLTAASGLFIILGLMGLIFGLTSRKEIIITENGITAPKSGLSKKNISISFSDITNINIQSVQKQELLNIFYKDGKLTIPQSMLPNKQSFDELVNLLSVRVNV